METDRERDGGERERERVEEQQDLGMRLTAIIKETWGISKSLL